MNWRLFLSIYVLALVGCFSKSIVSTESASKLTRIRQHKELRIGTTGDYRPFSLLAEGAGRFVGIDIDLARSLADFLGVRPTFVRTTWPSLMKDLANDRYDVALSGISKTREREETANFSAGYLVSGKTPISRCIDKERFSSLDKIDSVGVRVIVNPGGTNEKFARAHFRRATITTYSDNRNIFERIVAGEADVMVTDSEEVKFQTKLLPSLCASMPGQEFDPQEKAVLMPKDPALRNAVNAWLDEIKRTGKLQEVMANYLGK